MDPTAILQVDRAPKDIKDAERKEREGEEAAFDPRNRKRGRSSSKRRFLRKQFNIVDKKKETIKAQLEKDKKAREDRKRAETEGEFAWRVQYDILQLFK